MIRIFLFSLLLLTTISPSLAQSAKDEAKMVERLQKYFSKYKPKESRLARQPRMVDYVLNNEEHTLVINADDWFGYQEFTPEVTENIYKKIKGELPKVYRDYQVTVKTLGMTIDELIPNRLSRNADKSRLWGDIDYDGEPWVKNISKPYKTTHGLQNRHLSLWASHGRYFDQKKLEWQWQRPKLFGTTEDLFTQTIVVPYLIPMLENAGAIVYTPRERDWQTEEIIVDNDGSKRNYFEVTAHGKWQTTPEPGFAWHNGTYADNENPFEAGTVRMAKTTSSNKRYSVATYQPDFKKAGRYAVYVSYQTVPGSIDDALYTVWHKGERTQFRVNQQMGGSTWVYIGTFDFDAGYSEFNRVTVTNQSDMRGVVTTDAVRFGGGMGNIQRFGKTSGLPRALEGARYSAQWYGMPYSVYSSKQGEDDYGDDINVRSNATNLLGGSSCFMPTIEGRKVPIELSLAIHSDAGFFKDGKSVWGSLSICTTNHHDGKLNAGISRMASRDFADALLSNEVLDLKFKYGDWRRREIYDRNYSESRQPEVPSAILETLSHQSFPDMRYGQDPNFRFTLARSIYKTILRYVNDQHGRNFIVSPLAPDHFRIEFIGEGKIRLSWDAVDDPQEPSSRPSGYMLYTAMGESAFDNGQLVKKNSMEIMLEPHVLYHFRVSATNRGGESFPTEVLSALYTPKAQKTVMIVNGFQRLSSPAIRDNEWEQGFDLDEDPGITYGPTFGWVGRQVNFDRTQMGNENGGLGFSSEELAGQLIAGNDFNYVKTHAEAIASSHRYNIVSCSRKAVEDRRLELSPYSAVDVVMGLEYNDGHSLVPYKSFTSSLRQELKNYIQMGGALIISGAYLGSDMQSDSERQFMNSVLKCNYAGRNLTTTGQVTGMGTTLEYWNQLNSTHYAATHTDILQPVAPAFTVMQYADGNDAAIACKSPSAHLFIMGFPFECIKNEQQRSSIMQGILNYLFK
jgi:hypothetical protein